MNKVFVHGSTVRADGATDSFFTVECESRDAPLPHHAAGLSYTVTGYGARIPSRQMVKFNGRWRRVYVRIFSNIGTAYIGQLKSTGERLIVREYA